MAVDHMHELEGMWIESYSEVQGTPITAHRSCIGDVIIHCRDRQFVMLFFLTVETSYICTQVPEEVRQHYYIAYTATEHLGFQHYNILAMNNMFHV